MGLDEEKLKTEAIRDGIGRGILEAGEKDERVVGLTADVGGSVRMDFFAEKFPERFFDVGVAEQNLATVASGLANYGKIPFMASYAAFSPGRNWEQIRTTIALNNVPVKIIGCHAGLTVGPDGATHQALEDIALMRVMPNVTVIVPCDAEEARKAVLAAAKTNEPTYIRSGREKTAVITDEKTPFEIGKVNIMREGKDASVIACGIMVYYSLVAAEELAKEGIKCEVINCHTIKPIDEKQITESVKKTGAVVTCEEHQINGGLGSAIAEILAKNCPAPQEFIGVIDEFGQSGTADELIRIYGLAPDDIIEAVKRSLKRKNLKS